MNKIDRAIIANLQLDPRQSKAHLASKLDVSLATVQRHLKGLLTTGTIMVTAIPEPLPIGRPLTVYIFLQVRTSAVNTVAANLAQLSELHNVSICLGHCDIILWGLFASHEELADFVSGRLGRMDGIVRVDTCIQLREIKKRVYRYFIDKPFVPAKSTKPAMIKLDKLDRRLIIELQRDPRRSNRQLARVLDVSQSTIGRRVDSLLQSNALRFVAIPDPYKIGFAIHCYIGLLTDSCNLDTAARRLAKFPTVHYVGIFSGAYNILLGMNVRSHEELSAFLTGELGNLPGIIRSETIVHLKYFRRTYGWLREDEAG